LRKPKYLSPTSIDKYYSDPEEFYLMYLTDERPPKMPQTQPMSVGSAFDAHVKAYYYELLFGKGTNPEFEFETIFENQVEPHNRDWARHAGQHAFESYRASGACVDLLTELRKAKAEPRFEFTLEKRMWVGQPECPEGVNILGKPDVYFLNSHSCPIVLDWKVNGYCSKYNKSPAKGFVKCRDGWDSTIAKASRGANGQHKDAMVIKENGIKINVATSMEHVDIKWATQLATYAWLMGAQVGEQFICAIDQLCCKKNGSDMEEAADGSPIEVAKPLIRVAEHRCTISPEFQQSVKTKFINLWNIIEDGTHIFRELTLEQSQERCAALDKMHMAFKSDPEIMAPGTEDLFKEMMGR